MKDFPKGGLIGKTVGTLRWLSERNIPVYAANAGFFIVLSVFPALLLVLSSLRFSGLQVEVLLELLERSLPHSLTGAAEGLVYSTWRNASGRVAGFAALAALWSASRGTYGVVTGFNAVYGVSEDRGYLYTRGISVLYTFALGPLLLLTLLLHVYGGLLLERLRSVDIPAVIFVTELLDLRLVVLTGLQILLFTVMFMALPNKRNTFRSSLPGGILSALGWLIFSDLYSIFVEYFPRYANIYGSVYGIAVAMLWLHSCLSILLMGGAVNRLLMERRE